jgi:hypothetical protein
MQHFDSHLRQVVEHIRVEREAAAAADTRRLRRDPRLTPTKRRQQHTGASHSMRTHRTEHQLDCATRHRTRCTAQPRLQPPRPPLRAAAALGRHGRRSSLHALTRNSTLSSPRTPLILSPHRRRPLETPALSPPPSARGLHSEALEQLHIAALRHLTTPPSKRGHVGHIANNDSLNSRTTDAPSGARPQAPHRPPNSVPLHQPLPSTPLTHEAKALKDTRVLPLIHCICTAETH